MSRKRVRESFDDLIDVGVVEIDAAEFAFDTSSLTKDYVITDLR